MLFFILIKIFSFKFLPLPHFPPNFQNLHGNIILFILCQNQVFGDFREVAGGLFDDVVWRDDIHFHKLFLRNRAHSLRIDKILSSVVVFAAFIFLATTQLFYFIHYLMFPYNILVFLLFLLND